MRLRNRLLRVISISSLYLLALMLNAAFGQEEAYSGRGVSVNSDSKRDSQAKLKQEFRSDLAQIKVQMQEIKENTKESRSREQDLLKQINDALKSGDFQTARNLKDEFKAMHRQNIQQRQQDIKEFQEYRKDFKDDMKDKREDVRDRREDIRDRREDAYDRHHQGGPLDRLEDRRDRREDIRDYREDRRERRENRLDKRNNIRSQGSQGGLERGIHPTREGGTGANTKMHRGAGAKHQGGGRRGR